MKEEGISDEDIKKTFYVPVKMKIFAWNAKREMDTVMTPFDSIKYHRQLMQTSFAAMDPKNGEVKCWVGGIDYKWFKFDHVTAQRQVGSTFKPFVYTLGIMEAGYTPETVIPGGGLSLGGKVVSSGGGTVASCLAYSKNIAPWRMIAQIGVKRTIEFAQQCGIQTPLPPYYSIALGTGEVPMVEMLRGYSMFPNKGVNTEPILITRIEDKNGNLLEEFHAQSKQVIGEGDAYTMAKLMQGVIKFGTAKNLNNYKIPVEKAGKTGTTTGNTDGWFIGYTPELLAGTWVGCEDPFIRIYAGTAGGSEMAAPKWGIFMSKVYADKKLNYGKIKEFEKPLSIDNEEILADQNMARYFMQGDTTVDDQSGNGNADDFFDEPNTDIPPVNDVPIESKTLDTAKNRIPKPEDKVTSPANKPAEDKAKKDKPKPTSGSNDY
jgi:penicillin-binding protein 1A